jgi:hypothetical protein
MIRSSAWSAAAGTLCACGLVPRETSFRLGAMRYSFVWAAESCLLKRRANRGHFALAQSATLRAQRCRALRVALSALRAGGAVGVGDLTFARISARRLRRRVAFGGGRRGDVTGDAAHRGDVGHLLGRATRARGSANLAAAGEAQRARSNARCVCRGAVPGALCVGCVRPPAAAGRARRCRS